ncbi:MAG: M90 family metallopeptidase [Planctomycetota bacterium]|jgi:Mlc titration factor MtfA (ptsG expression regulator)
MYAAISIIGGLILVLLGIFIWRRTARNARRKRLLAEPIKTEWKLILEKNIPLYQRLPQPLKAQLEARVNVFLAEKKFEGCGGQEITDEVKVTIAGQACILLLNRKTKYFSRLYTIYVYPAAYVAKQVNAHGWTHDQPRMGESWQNGPVVLTWNSVTGGANNIHDGRNIVFHEFSHQLDQENGDADGAPILENRSCYATWAKVLSAEYETLQKKAKKGRKSVLNQYGATNPTEFFAVATEAFLEKSKQMKKKHPDLYQELKNYYKLNPVEWM